MMTIVTTPCPIEKKLLYHFNRSGKGKATGQPAQGQAQGF